jgi:hypothetical protein
VRGIAFLLWTAARRQQRFALRFLVVVDLVFARPTFGGHDNTEWVVRRREQSKLRTYTLDACSAPASSPSPYGSCVAACPFPLTQIPPDARILPANANAAHRRAYAYPLAESIVLIAHAPAHTMPADAPLRTTPHLAAPVPTLGSLKSTPTPRGQITGWVARGVVS